MNFQIDTFKDGDESQIHQLYNSTYASYNGFVNRNPDELKRLFLDHPHIGSERLLVAKYDNKLFGYLAYSNQTNPLIPNLNVTSEISDFCVLKGKHGTEAGRMLLKTFVSKSNTDNINSCSIKIPTQNRQAHTILNSCGFSKIDMEQNIVVPIIDFKMLIESRLLYKKSCKALRNCRIHISQDFSQKIISLGNGNSMVLDIGKYKKGHPEIFCGVLVLSDILVRTLSPLSAFLNRKLIIKPFLNSITVLKELHEISLDNNWVLPTIDWR